MTTLDGEDMVLPDIEECDDRRLFHDRDKICQTLDLLNRLQLGVTPQVSPEAILSDRPLSLEEVVAIFDQSPQAKSLIMKHYAEVFWILYP